MPVGRPSDFTQETADKICERLADGESLRKICISDGMPRQPTVFRWLANNEEFRKQYALAREAQADTLFDEVLDIADDATNDWMERHAADNVSWVENGEAIQRSKIRIDTRKWIAAKLNARKYGERQAIEHTGKDGAPIEVEAKPPREVAKMILALIQKANTDEGKSNG